MERLKKLAEIAVLLPIAHLTICVIFLAGYVMCFGGNVSSLFSITDSFTVTLGQMVTIYTFGLALPALVAWLTHLRAVSIAQEPQPEYTQEQLDQSQATIHKILFLSNWIILIFIFILLTFDWYFFHIRSHFLYQLNFVIILLTIQKLFDKVIYSIQVGETTRQACWIVFVFLISTFGAGLDNGESDRATPYNELKENHFGCSNLLVIRSISSNYIAVAPNNMRYVIDSKCKIMFTFPKTDIFSTNFQAMTSKTPPQSVVRTPPPIPSTIAPISYSHFAKATRISSTTSGS